MIDCDGLCSLCRLCGVVFMPFTRKLHVFAWILADDRSVFKVASFGVKHMNFSLFECNTTMNKQG